MKFRKSMIILMLVVFFISIAGICASDVNDTTVASEDTQLMDEIIQASENQENVIQESNNDELALSEDDSSDDSGKTAISNDKTLGITVTKRTFDAIERAIESDCTIYLESGNYTGDSSIYIFQKNNVKIIGNSTILDAQGQTGIFDIRKSSNITIQGITFKNASSMNVGAISLFGSCDNCSISNCTFINNHAENGGAISWSTWCHNGRIYSCTFINNHADENGGAIRWYDSDGGRVNNCTFINNHADKEDGAICAIGYDLNADYNWFGNTATNYNDSLPINRFVRCDYRLFLDATANPDKITSSDTSNITFKLYQYHSGEISDYDNAPFKNIYLTITATNGNVSGTAKLDEPILFTPTAKGTATVTATFENVVQTVEINVLKGDFDLLQDLVNNESLSVINLERNYTYNDLDTIREGVRITRPITINGNGYTIDAKGKSRVFNVEASDVTINNLTIKNANYNGDGGGAIYFSNSGCVTNCNFTDNHVIGDFSKGGAIRMDVGTVENCKFIGNEVTGFGSCAGAVFVRSNGNVTNCNFTNNTAVYFGGAVYFNNNGNVTNCKFTGNKATSSSGWGGAIMFVSTGTASNCNFTGNEAWYGGAIYFNEDGNVGNCNFTNNKATGDNSYGGAIEFKGTGNVTNCNFTGNEAWYGGAIEFKGTGSVTNCNFTGNEATGDYSYGGGAICMSSGTVENCNFTDNIAQYLGGAVYFSSNGNVTNCDFTNNIGISMAGAIFFNLDGNVINCNFTGNKAHNAGAINFKGTGNVTNCNFTGSEATSGKGGALYFWNQGTVETCNFTDNTATDIGGAVYFINRGTVTNCNFTGNEATVNGGAIYFYNIATVTNCNFTGNNAGTGSAIYFRSSNPKSISNSTFLNNRANATDLQIEKTYNKIKIIFTGQNNLLNAIYSENNAVVSFTNVTYWGANGITNTGNVTTRPSRSSNEAGQNITVTVVVNDILILNATKVTDEDGTIILDVIAGNYTVTAHHDMDSYYTEAERTETFNIVYETSLELSAFEFTVIAKITPDDVVGNITFTVENESGIVKTLETALSNGTADLDLSDLLEGEYNITATYAGSSQYNPSKANMSYQKVKLDVNINVSADSVTYGENVAVSISGTAPGYYTVTVNNITKDVLIDNPGVPASVDFGILDAGSYNINASYAENLCYHAAVNDTEVAVVNKADVTIGVVANAVTYGEAVIVEVTGSVDGDYSVIVNGISKDVVLIAGEAASVNFGALNGGAYDVVASYWGDVNYNEASVETTVKVNRATPTISVSADNITYGEDLVVNVELSDNVYRRAIVTVGNETKYASLTDGVGFVKFRGLAAGTYTVTATYNGDANYDRKASANTTVKVERSTPTIKVTTKHIAAGDDLIVNVKVSDAISRRVIVTIGNETKLVKLTNGTGFAKFSGLTKGTYTVIATYNGDVNYDRKASANTTVTVYKGPANIKATAEPAALGEDVVIDLQLPSEITRRVNVTLGNETKFVKLTNGTASVKFTGLPLGTYNATVTYKGDENYTKSSLNLTVKVVKATPEIQVTANNITSGEALVVDVQLPADVIKRAIVKVDDVEKYASLKNGAGSVKFTGLEVGTHTVEVSYAGDAKYKKASTTTTIEVKE